MNCSEFEGNIQSFINGELPDEIYDGFIEHYNKCGECREELEILYLVHHTISSEELDDVSFNLKEKLENHMQEMQNQVYRRYKHRFLRNSAIAAAELTACGAGTVFVLSLL